MRRPLTALALGAAAVLVSITPAGAHTPVQAPHMTVRHSATASGTQAAPVSLSGWNLTLPVDSNGGTTGDAVTVSPATLYSPWLTQDSTGALNFWAPADGALLGISSHARTELRGTGTFTLGQGSAGLNETVTVTQEPDQSHNIIIGQMFPTGTTPFAMMHYQSGKVYGYIHGQSGQYTLMTGIPLGATFSDSITASGSTVTFSVTYQGHTVTQAATGISSWIGDTMHFQAGDYQQDLQGSATTDGGRVTFSALSEYGVTGQVGNDFSIADSPASGSVVAGSSVTTSVSTAVTSGSPQSVALSASGLPSGATASFSPATVTAGGNSTLTIATGTSTPAGTYPVTVTGTAASGMRTATYTLTVTSGTTAGNDFSVSDSPTSGSVVAGSPVTTSVSTAVTSGSAQSVALSASGLPAGAAATFNPATVTAGGSSTLTISTAATTAPGTYAVTVTGTGTSGAHSTTYTLTVTAPSGGCNLAWSATTSYVPGDTVSYGGHNYTALYWSTDVTPGSAIAWNIWQDNGPC